MKTVFTPHELREARIFFDIFQEERKNSEDLYRSLIREGKILNEINPSMKEDTKKTFQKILDEEVK